VPGSPGRVPVVKVEAVIEHVRRRVPARLLPALVHVRAVVAWCLPSVRSEARRQMGFLLGESPSIEEASRVSRRYVREMARRAEVRWHPAVATKVQVVGADHLDRARALGRGVVLSFMHHGLYDRAFPSLGGRTSGLRMLVHPYMLEAEAPGWVRQHVRLNCLGGGVAVSTAIGSDGIMELLRAEHVVAIASDVPGRTPVTFAGRQVLGSFGAARIAWESNSPVVLMTSERVHRGPVVRLHPPLDPHSFGSAQDLFEAMLRTHESAVLAWPEATDLPLSRWGASATPMAVP
jgi:lauroyl/myristoyl acyltransferase